MVSSRAIFILYSIRSESALKERRSISDNMSRSVRGILFNCISPRQNQTVADICVNYLKYCVSIESSPVSDMRPISEGLIKRKVFAGAHTI